MITTTMQLRYVYYQKYSCNMDGKDKKSTIRVTCSDNDTSNFFLQVLSTSIKDNIVKDYIYYDSNND